MTAVGLFVRLVHLAAVVGLVGVASALLLAGPSDRSTARRWQRDLRRWSRALVLLALVAGAGAIVQQAAVLEGSASALDAQAFARLLLGTQGGAVWLVRGGLLLILAAFLAVRGDIERGADWIAVRGQAALLAVAALALLAAAGHAAAVEPGTARAIAVDALHVVAAGTWAGALLPLAILWRRAGRDDGADSRPYATLAAHRFSRWALGAVSVAVVTGALNAIVQVGSIAALVGTPYGRLLLGKLLVLVGVLAIGAVNRRRLVPALAGDGAGVGRPAMRRLGRFATAEAAGALVVLAVVATMASTPPARHVPPVWPFTSRLSIGALAAAPELRTLVLVGSQITVLGVAALLASFVLRAWRFPLLGGAAVLLAVGAAVALPPLAIDAYPTTYVRPTVPYTAASIANGMELYRQHCAVCHGPRGAGDGPARGRLPRPPADLRAAHTRDHTAGDLFWWISHGIARGGMPGFASALGEDERWDVVNLVRALGAASSARALGEVIGPPRLVAPDFTFAVGPTPPHALRDYRSRRIVLLVLYALPASRPRLAQLAERYDVLVTLGVEVIAVDRAGGPDAIARLGGTPPVFFPVVTEGGREVVAAYDLFREGPHTEFLIDRQGYLRARSTGGEAPAEINPLLAQLQELNAEKPAVTAPDDHVH
jgi:putative copper resistance protein D